MNKTSHATFFHVFAVLIVISNLFLVPQTRVTAAASAPPPPVITDPSSPIITRAESYSIWGTAMAGTRVEIYIDANGNGKKDKTEKKPVASQQLVSGEIHFSVSVPLSPNKTNLFVVIAVLASGQESASTAVPPITQDAVNPILSNLTAYPDPFSPNGDGVKDSTDFSYSLSKPALISVVVIDSTGALVRSLATGASRPAGGSLETWNGQNDSGNTAADGTYSYKIDATDSAGNVAVQQSGLVTVDSIAPVVEMTEPLTNVLTNNPQPQLSANVFDLNGIEHVKFQLSRDGGTNWTDLGEVITTAPYTLIPSSPLGSGGYQARVVATDLAGNQSISSPVDFTVDTIPPDAPTNLAAHDHLQDLGGVIDLDWIPSASADAVSQRLYRSNSSGSGYSLIAEINNNTINTYTDNGLSDGVTYYYILRSVDAAGNESSASDEARAVPVSDLDVTPPVTTITSAPPNPTTETTASFSFSSSEADSTFECDLDAGGFDSCTSPRNYSNLSLGNHMFSVRAIDAFNNVDPNPAIFSWIVEEVTPAAVIETVAGNGTAGYGGDGGSATQAILAGPFALAFGPDGSLYFSDSWTFRIRRIGPDGIITTVAGDGYPGYSGDGGPVSQAGLRNVTAIAVGGDGSIYFADQGNYRVRRIGPDGIITTVAGNGNYGSSGDGGPATQASLNPYGIALGPDNSLYITDYYANSIRRVGPDGIITTVAGPMCFIHLPDGTIVEEWCFYGPFGLAFGPDGSLYTSGDSQRVKLILPRSTTVAGTGTRGYSGDGGPATEAMLDYPREIAIGPDGSLYIADLLNNRVRRVGPDGIITTIAGNGIEGYSGDGGPATQAMLYNPYGVAVGPDNYLYIADYRNHRIRRVGPLPQLSLSADIIAP